MSILKEKSGGKTGMKRVIGLIIILVSIFSYLVDQFSDNEANETLWITMFSAGVILIGSTLIPKINK